MIEIVLFFFSFFFCRLCFSVRLFCVFSGLNFLILAKNQSFFHTLSHDHQNLSVKTGVL